MDRITTGMQYKIRGFGSSSFPLSLFFSNSYLDERYMPYIKIDGFDLNNQTKILTMFMIINILYFFFQIFG